MAPKLRRRKGDLSDKLEGGCAKCCAKYCRMTPMTQALCCMVVVLGVTGAVVWLGGSVVGSGSGGNACAGQSSSDGEGNDYAPSLNIFLANTGIVVMIMLIASCICCFGFAAVCCGDLPLVAKVIGVVCLVIAGVVAFLFAGWLTYGAYALTSQPDCIVAIVYLIMLIVYLFVFLAASVVGIIWKLYDIRTGGKQSFKVNLPT